MKKKVLLTMMTMTMMTAFAACGASEKESTPQTSELDVVETVAVADTTVDTTVDVTVDAEPQEETESTSGTEETEVGSEEAIPLTADDTLCVVDLLKVHVGGDGLGALTFVVDNSSDVDYFFGDAGVIESKDENGEWTKIENVNTIGEVISAGQSGELEIIVESETLIGNGFYRIIVNGMEFEFVIDSFEE